MPRLDTLFLAMPISWKGTLAQYVGRLHRDHVGKKEVVVYDDVDVEVPVLARMAARRRAGYKRFGIQSSIDGSDNSQELEPSVAYIAGDDRLPSEVVDEYWIYAERRDRDSYPEHSERGGKWMLFIKNAEIDSWWSRSRPQPSAGCLAAAPR